MLPRSKWQGQKYLLLNTELICTCAISQEWNVAERFCYQWLFQGPGALMVTKQTDLLLLRLKRKGVKQKRNSGYMCPLPSRAGMELISPLLFEIFLCSLPPLEYCSYLFPPSSKDCILQSYFSSKGSCSWILQSCLKSLTLSLYVKPVFLQLLKLPSPVHSSFFAPSSYCTRTPMFSLASSFSLSSKRSISVPCAL